MTQLPNNRNIRLDFIRGIAVLGILMMNIQAFAFPFAAYGNPTVFPEFSGNNVTSYWFTHLIFDQKFMGIFSILFGVGIHIFAKRVAEREGHAGKRHYMRMVWLLLFGLIHAYFIWWGDILVAYAITGCLTFLFLEATNKTLLWSASGMLVALWLMIFLPGFLFPFMPEDAIASDILPLWQPSQENLNAEISAYTGSWADAFWYRLQQVPELQSYTLMFVFKTLALNLIGIVLYRSGFFDATWKKSSYLLVLFIGIGLGSALTTYGALNNIEQSFHWKYSMAFGAQYNYWGSTFSALGYCALIVLLCYRLPVGKIIGWFSNVGKMAFTNYIMQSIICSIIFYGFGFGFYGELNRLELIYTTVGIWSLLIIVSNIWMHFFKFGPLEWVWRCLTYGKVFSIK